MESKAPVRHAQRENSSNSKRAGAKHAAKHDAAFMKAWRETLEASMQPRDESAPTAKQRMDALRARLVARGNATGSS